MPKNSDEQLRDSTRPLEDAPVIQDECALRYDQTVCVEGKVEQVLNAQDPNVY